MIDVALDYVRKMLDQNLMTNLGLESSIVVLNNLVDTSGNSPQKNQNKMVVTLVNLEYETNKQFYGGYRRDTAQISYVNPPVLFNLDVLFSANFDEYGEALKFLTATIAFFQENVSFSRANHPTLPQEISALKFEIENTPSNKTHNLWTALGAKYVPSIVYKIRHAIVDYGQIKGASSAITNSQVEATP